MPAGTSRSTEYAHRKPALPPIVLFLACTKLAIELPYATAYGFFRDELYYLACARHLAWGYVDHPPLSIAILAFVRSFAGESLTTVRVVPAIVGALVIGLTAAIAKTFGGDTRAQGLAALCALVAPEYLASSHYYSMNSFDVLFWTLAALAAARALKAEPGKGRAAWVMLGIALGLGLENKLSVLWYGAGLLVGILVSPSRVALKTRWPWIAGLLALGMLLPYVRWEQANGWPTREFVHNATTLKMASISPWELFHEEVNGMMALSAPLWLLGLGVLLASKRFVRFRALGVAFVVVFVLLAVNQKSRAGYLAPAFPPLFAAAAVWADDWLSARVWAYPVLALALLFGGAVSLPFAVPVLPVRSFIRYAERLGQAPKSDENKDMGPLPQFYADQFGWKEMAKDVAMVFEAIPEEERRHTAIYASNYGEAGAIDAFGPEMGLPAAISGHNNYWLWGPLGASGRVVLLVGSDPERWRPWCESMEVASVFSHSLVMPYESHLRISICRNTKVPLEELWPTLKHFE